MSRRLLTLIILIIVLGEAFGIAVYNYRRLATEYEMLLKDDMKVVGRLLEGASSSIYSMKYTVANYLSEGRGLAAHAISVALSSAVSQLDSALQLVKRSHNPSSKLVQAIDVTVQLLRKMYNINVLNASRSFEHLTAHTEEYLRISEILRDMGIRMIKGYTISSGEIEKLAEYLKSTCKSLLEELA